MLNRGLYNRPPSIYVTTAVRKRQNSLQHVQDYLLLSDAHKSNYFFGGKEWSCHCGAYNLNYLVNEDKRKDTFLTSLKSLLKNRFRFIVVRLF